jgi:hypothetical protein
MLKNKTVELTSIYKQGFDFKLTKNLFCKNLCEPPNGQNNILIIESSGDSSNQVNKNINTIQYQATIAIFIINTLIMNKKFDILFNIYQNIIKEYMPMNDIYNKFNTDSDKLEFLKSVYEPDKIKKIQLDTINNIDFYFKEIVDFQYFEAQHEGIYINQNIMGLLKHLVKNILKLPDDRVKEIIKNQPENLDFETQILNYRKINFKLYSDKNSRPLDYTNFEPYQPYENIYRSIKILDELYKNAKGDTINIDMKFVEGTTEKTTEKISLDAYSSDKYFEISNSTKKPFMGQIIDLYMNPRLIKGIEVKPITNIKIFYLFSNNAIELKCNHQANLLFNTLSLIDAIKN